MTGAPRLRALQQWLQFVTMHPATADVAVRDRRARAQMPLAAVLGGAVVLPGERMSVTERLQVYNGGYLARLQGVLASDYGAVQRLLGERRWARLCADYVAAHPSRHPNLSRFGAQLPRFVGRQRDLRSRPFAQELAQLCWLCAEAFHAADAAPLAPERLQRLAPADLPRLRLTVHPSLRLATFAHPVNAAYTAHQHAPEQRVRTPHRRRTFVAVHRHEQRVLRLGLPPAAFAVLRALATGTTVGRALRHATDQVAVGRWFQQWTADGLFTAAQVQR